VIDKILTHWGVAAMTVRPNEEVQQMNTHADPLSAGARDIRRAAQILASRVPGRLAPLAEVAYNFSWTWRHDGEPVFRSIDAYRWRLCRQNPVRLLQEAPEESLERAAMTPSLVARAEALRDALEADKGRPLREAGDATAEHPVAFFCAEFGVHR
jgi:starch phosphorylase